MNIQKTMLATALLAFLTGCGSSGGSSSQPTSNNEVKNDQATQAQAEKQKNEVQALKQQLAQTQKEKKSIEDKLQQIDQISTQTLSKTKSELQQANFKLLETEDRLTKAEQFLTERQEKLEKLQKEQARLEQAITQATSDNTEKTQKIEILKEQKNQVENELSLEKEKLENALKDKVQIQQEFNTYKQKIDEFNKLIKTVVENEREQGRYNSAIGGRYTANIGSLPNGLYQIPFVMMYSEDGLGETSGGYSTIYKQAYSIVYGREHKFFSQDFTSDGNYRIEKNTGGEKTIALPSEGLATYNGKAFTSDHEGELTYTVNFTDRTGSGKLSNFKDIDDISLNSGEISSGSNMIKSSASMANGTQGEYELSFYGPNAEEIAGKAYIYKQLDNTKHVNGGTAREYNQKDDRGELIRGTQFGFGGTRGEIQK